MIDYTRDDVIEALEYLLSPVCTETQYDYCDEIRAAIAFLKEEEPRVMTREELTQIKPWSVYWGEGLYVRNLWPMAFTAEAIKNIDGEYLKDSYGRAYELDLYNKDVMGWRIWTARPAKDQRKAVKWDE